MTTAEATSPAFLGDAEFVQEELLGLLAANGRTTSGSYRFELVDSEDPTKITAEYRLDDGSRLFAKLYAGGDEGGGHCYAVMRALWEGGFGPTSRYRVAEPLGYLPERRVLVTREAHGTCVVDHLGTDSAEQFGGCGSAPGGWAASMPFPCDWVRPGRHGATSTAWPGAS